MPTPDEIEILDSVRGLLEREFGFAPAAIELSTHLIDDLDFDSIDAISLAVRVEEELGIKLEEEVVQRLRTIAQVVGLLAAERARGPS